MSQPFKPNKPVVFAGTEYSHLERASTICPVSSVILPPNAPSFQASATFSSSGRFTLTRTVDYTDFEEALLQTPKGSVLQIAGLSHRINQKLIDHFDAIYNFHPGSLTNNRGARPEIQSVLRRDKNLVFTIHRIDSEKMDCGPTLQTFSLPIEYRLGWGTLYLQLCQLRELAAVWLFSQLAKGVRPEEHPSDCPAGSYLAKPSDELVNQFFSFDGSLEDFLKTHVECS